MGRMKELLLWASLDLSKFTWSINLSAVSVRPSLSPSQTYMTTNLDSFMPSPKVETVR